MKKRIITILSTIMIGICLIGCNKTTSSSSKSTSKPTELEIISQPLEVQHCLIPDGYSLEVKVNNESLVKSYRWQFNNAVREEKQDWIYLDGLNATYSKFTNTASKSNDHYAEYRCAITDINDNITYSNSGKIYFDNKYSYVPVIYVGENAVRGGETLDLSTTNLGSGKVSLNNTGSEVTIDNVNIDNTEYLKYNSEGSTCFEILSYGYPYKEFTVNLKGNNEVLNTFWQPDHNASGAPFCFNFMRQFEGDIPLIENIKFTGDGTLSITGGTHLIYANTKVTVDCDMIFGTVEDHYGSGIYCDEIEILEGHSLSGSLNGYVLLAEIPHHPKANVQGNITIHDNVSIVMEVKSPFVSAGACKLSMINAYNDLTINNATISLSEVTLAERYIGKSGIGEIVGLKSRQGNISIKNSTIKTTINATEYDSLYASSCGFIVASDGNINIDQSFLTCDCETPYITGGKLISSKGNIAISNSIFRGKMYVNGSIEGISSNGTISTNNSHIFVDVYSFNHSSKLRGVITAGLTIGNNVQFDIKTTQGIAILVQIGAGEEKREYEEGYVPTIFTDVNITTPESSLVNVYSIEGSKHNYVYMETIYVSNDVSIPASNVSFYKA